MIKCIVFDFDGVLVDSNAVKRGAYFDIFASPGAIRPIVQAVLEDARNGDRYQIIERILWRLVMAGFFSADNQIDELIAKYAEQYNDICEEHATTCREIAGASVCLPRLARRYALYVNSATPEEPLRRVVRQRHWEGYFRGVLGRPRTKVDNLTWIMQRENVESGAVVFVGDGQRDLEAARACSCHFVGIRNPDNDFDSQDLILLDNLYGLEDVILEQCGETR